MNFNYIAAVVAVAMGLGGCAGMSHTDKTTAAGAAIGGVAGSVLTDSALGTVGGAAVGGLLGREYGKRNP